jgi:hydrogenase nickel incorporation protein HypA/HybF
MHEFSLMEDLFKLIKDLAEKNKLKRVTKITLQIGKLRQVQPDFLEFAFEIISKDTIASDAKLIIQEIPVVMECKSCGEEFKVEENTFICAKCASSDLVLKKGKEIILENIEGEK